MAREDLLTNLLSSLMTKEEQPAPDDNTLIQKMIAPNEQITPLDVFLMSKSKVNALLWGGTGVIAGWVWNRGQYAGYGSNIVTQNLIEAVVPTDNLVMSHSPSTSLKWGGTGITAGWTWNAGQYS